VGRGGAKITQAMFFSKENPKINQGPKNLAQNGPKLPSKHIFQSLLITAPAL
jgi:hypothetical protein